MDCGTAVRSECSFVARMACLTGRPTDPSRCRIVTNTKNAVRPTHEGRHVTFHYKCCFNMPDPSRSLRIRSSIGQVGSYGLDQNVHVKLHVPWKIVLQSHFDDIDDLRYDLY